MTSFTSFREFLAEKAREDESMADRKSRRNDWIAAVERLLDQFRAWLKEADPNELLEIYPLQFDKVERGLGAYTLTGLKIGLGDAAVEVVPVGRNVRSFLGPDGEIHRAEGRIDLRAGAQKYSLFHTVEDGQDVWVAVGDDPRKGGKLDQARFEAILLDLLS